MNTEFSVMDDGDPMELDTEFITITIDGVNRPPVFTTNGSKEGLENELLEFTVAAYDPDNNNFEFSADGVPAGATFEAASGIFSWTPDNTHAGVYTVTFYATDDGDPVMIGETETTITVGDVPTPLELAEDLMDVIIQVELPKNVENSYLANLKKLGTFIDAGKVTPAINQLNAFIGKVTQDIASGEISETEGNQWIMMAADLIEALGW